MAKKRYTPETIIRKLREDEAHAGDYGVHGAFQLPLCHPDPGDQHQEGKVQVNIDSAQPGDFPGPFHCLSQ